MPSERTPPRSSTLRSFTRSKTRESPSPTSPLQRCSRSYFRSSLSASSANLTPQQRSESERQEEEEEDQLASTATLVGDLDFPDVVCKLDGEVNEGERRVQLGLAKFMAVDEDARARDVLSAMEKTWGLDRPGALFSLAGGVTNLKLHTVLAQVCTRCTRRCTPAPAAPPACTSLRTSSASPLRPLCAGSHAGLRQGGTRHTCMGDLWRSGRWRHVDDRRRPPQGGHDPHPRPRPSLARTLNLALDPPLPPTHAPTQRSTLHYLYPHPYPHPHPQPAQAGIWSPCIGVAPWGVLDEELQNGMQAAHENGTAYEVPRRLSRDDASFGGTSARGNNRRGRGIGGGSRDASPLLQRSHSGAAKAAVDQAEANSANSSANSSSFSRSHAAAAKAAVDEAAANSSSFNARTAARPPQGKRSVGWGAAVRTASKDSLPTAESAPSLGSEKSVDGGGGGSGSGDGDGDGDGDGLMRPVTSPEWNRVKSRTAAAVRFRGAISLVKAAERMRDGAERERVTTFETSSDAVWLEPHHSHILVVKRVGGEKSAEVGSEWGREMPLRKALEERLQRFCRVPRLMLAVQGGRGTFDAIVQAVVSGCPVVVARESGGAAELV